MSNAMVLRKCTICDRRFKKTEHFKRHERSHTKERPYECNVCHKRFSRSQTAVYLRVALLPAPSAENGSRLVHTATTEVHPLPNVTTPRDLGLSGAGVSSNSLDFLADISAHHGRNEPEIHPMLLDDQHPYFGWGEMTPADPNSAQRNSLGFEGVPNDMLHMWLEPRTESSSNQGSSDLMRDVPFPMLCDNAAMTPGQQTRHSVDSGKSSEHIPNERFSKVQRCWFTPLNYTGRLMNSLWRDIVYTNVDNIFSDSRRGIDDDCRRRLQHAFAQPLSHYPQLHSPSHGSTSPPLSGTSNIPYPNFPPAEVLDMALDLYFRTFHPLVPFVHLPTFVAKKSRLPLLYTMCLIGMMMMGTKGTASFVQNNFKHMLEKVTVDLTRCTMGTSNPADTVSTLATAFLFLNLAVLTGDKGHLENVQMLYVNLMSVAQRHGLFSATEGQILDMSLFEAVPDIEMRWKAWSKVESTKRVIIGLLLVDSWYSSLLSTSPIILPDSIQIIMPCNEALFRAHSSMRWTQLIRSGKRILMSTVLAPSENIHIPAQDGPMDDLNIQAILAMVHLRQSEAYHRLLSNRSSYPFAPCHTFAMDGRARCLPDLQRQIITDYGDTLSQLNPNALITWHYMCMMLTADIQIFDLAAGRSGPIPARKALDDIAEWSQTPAARRACIHASHIWKAMVNRKAADHPSFHSLFALFASALVLGLYTFMVPNSGNTPSSVGTIELMDDVDWRLVGTEGFTSFMEPRGSQSFSPTDDAAVNFIRNGAIIYYNGMPFQEGYQSSRKILLDFANLLKDSGKWSSKKFSYVLHIMSDVLLDVD
ncbi:transcriptional regulator family: C2H2 zinc finger and Fungal Specific TF [Penicillium chermesinum]|nr:transcriptional regulator family: C2H2 zinc finger and Fungal Specific TF [Penicillium chermesinum]